MALVNRHRHAENRKNRTLMDRAEPRVLHVGKYFPPYAGGMETYLRDLMVAQSKQGLESCAVVHQSEITLQNQTDTYETDRAPLKIVRAAVWARFLFTPISPLFPWLLSRTIKWHKPDILHLHMPNVSAFWALFIPAARRIPWVVHWHADVLASEYSLGLRIFYTLYRPFERALLRKSKAIIVTSPPYLASSAVLAEFMEKCEVVPLGLDPTYLPEPDKQTPAKTETEPLRVLAIGRLTYYKGFEYLIQATAGVADVVVHLVGTGDEEIKLKALARKLGLEHRIFHHGRLTPEQLAQQFLACDCLCLPSLERTEAFGMVLLEAMYCGKATLVSDVHGSGMGWVVENNKTGLKVPPKNVQKLTDGLKQLQGDHDKMRIFGEQGRQKFDREFHIDRSAARVAEVYEKALEKVACCSEKDMT